MRADMKRKRHTDNVNESFVNGATEAATAFSKVDEPTLLYFKEIRAHLDGAEEEQRSTLATNALLEANGKQLYTEGVSFNGTLHIPRDIRHSLKIGNYACILVKFKI